MRALLLHALPRRLGRNTVWVITRRIKTAMESFARFAWSCAALMTKRRFAQGKVTTLPRAESGRKSKENQIYHLPFIIGIKPPLVTANHHPNCRSGTVYGRCQDCAAAGSSG